MEELVPKTLGLGEVQKVLQNLLKEGISIRDLLSIFETLASVRWVAIIEGGSTTVYPIPSALSLCPSVIQMAGRWKDGSNVG